MLPGTHVAHVAIYDFGVHADDQLRGAVKDARASGARGLLVDVRADPGGLKDQAVAVTSEFLKDGNVFIERDAQGHETAIPVHPGGVATDIPTVVLIDKGTASSAEIFAGALQDYGRAKLVGMTTFGTGTVLKSFSLSDGSAVLLAVIEWLTPKERQIWHHGVVPDKEVALPEGAPLLLPDDEPNLDAKTLEQAEDKQLLAGLKILEEEMGLHADSRGAASRK
jgi:carboxyl-terminal processing protease